MNKFILTSRLLVVTINGIAQCPPEFEAQLNALKDSCAASYNHKYLLLFIEKYKATDICGLSKNSRIL